MEETATSEQCFDFPRLSSLPRKSLLLPLRFVVKICQGFIELDSQSSSRDAIAFARILQ